MKFFSKNGSQEKMGEARREKKERKQRSRSFQSVWPRHDGGALSKPLPTLLRNLFAVSISHEGREGKGEGNCLPA